MDVDEPHGRTINCYQHESSEEGPHERTGEDISSRTGDISSIGEETPPRGTMTVWTAPAHISRVTQTSTREENHHVDVDDPHNTSMSEEPHDGSNDGERTVPVRTRPSSGQQGPITQQRPAAVGFDVG
jgi:hypothetical protein